MFSSSLTLSLKLALQAVWPSTQVYAWTMVLVAVCGAGVKSRLRHAVNRLLHVISYHSGGWESWLTHARAFDARVFFFSPALNVYKDPGCGFSARVCARQPNELQPPYRVWNTIGDKITARKFDCSVRVLCWWSSSIRQLSFLVRELSSSVRELSSSVP